MESIVYERLVRHRISRLPVVNVMTLIAAAALLWMLWAIVTPYVNARRLRGRTAPPLFTGSGQPASSTADTLVYFWSPHCHMCVGMSGTIDKLIAQDAQITKVKPQDGGLVGAGRL